MIIDCVPYFREGDLLELRMRELDPVVDLFIVVEGDRTHAGAPKPSYLPDSLRRAFGHKLHTVTARLPEGEGLTWTWRREIAQRNAIADALRYIGARSDDMVLISDCDEIPRRAFVGMLPSLPDDGVAIARQRMHYYSFNHIAHETHWTGTRATQYGNVAALSPDGVRYVAGERGGYPRRFYVADAGWHFSYFGGAEAIATKIGSFLHQELNHGDVRDPETIARRVAAGEDVYGRDQRFAIDWAADLPDAVTERPGRWASHFHPDHAPRFTEDWMSDDQCAALASLARMAPKGAAVEIGAWEGKSTIAIAGVREVAVVDTWAGNIDEGADHPSVRAAAERDVFAQFLHNVRAFGVRDTADVYRLDWRAYIWPDNLAFVHLDAAHDAETVRAQLDAALPRMVAGGIICGDDFAAPGVHVPVLERLPNAQSNGKLWWWTA